MCGQSVQVHVVVEHSGGESPEVIEGNEDVGMGSGWRKRETAGWMDGWDREWRFLRLAKIAGGMSLMALLDMSQCLCGDEANNEKAATTTGVDREQERGH